MIGNSVVECDEIIDTTKTIPPKSTSTKNVSAKSTLTNFYILLAFLLITIALLIAVNIYLIKHRSKQEHLYNQLKNRIRFYSLLFDIKCKIF